STLAAEDQTSQLAQRADEAHFGLLRTGLAAFLWLRRRASPRRPGRAWRGLARALHEPRGAERRSTATAAPTATTSTPSKPESLREPLQITREQCRLQGPEHLRVGAGLFERLEHHLDAAQDQPRAP